MIFDCVQIFFSYFFLGECLCAHVQFFYFMIVHRMLPRKGTQHCGRWMETKILDCF